MYEAALALSVVCFVLVAGYFVRSPSFSLFHPLTFYLAFHGFIFVFRPIIAFINDFNYVYRGYAFNPSLSDKLTVIVASNLGFLSFAFFCLRIGNVAMRFKLDGFAIAERERLKPKLVWVLALCVPIGLYSLASALNLAGGTAGENDALQVDFNTGISIYVKGSGYLAEAQLMLATCGALVAWVFRFRFLAIAPLLAFVVLRAGTGGRGPFVIALVAVGLLYLYEHRRRVPSFRISLLLVATVMVFSFVGNDRGRAIRNIIGKEETVNRYELASARAKFLEGMDFANLEYFEYLVYAVPQRSNTYGYFLDTLQIFTEPIPRAIWKDKPIGAPFNRIFLMKYGRNFGMTRSLPGQGWYSLGWLGVGIWCGLWGYVLGWIYRRFVEGPQSAFKTTAYMIFAATLIVDFRDGELVTLFRQCLFYLGPIVLWYYLARYLGVPSASTMRAAAARRLRGRGPGNPATETGADVADPRVQALPPAVARRRVMLLARMPSEA